MNIRELFPQTVLTTELLEPGQFYRAVIDRVEKRDGPLGPRALVVLATPVRGCRFVYLNRTSAFRIAEVYGEETDGWKGREVLIGRKKFYGGKEGVLVIPNNIPKGGQK